jgi:hypothetical protein
VCENLQAYSSAHGQYNNKHAQVSECGNESKDHPQMEEEVQEEESVD